MIITNLQTFCISRSICQHHVGVAKRRSRNLSDMLVEHAGSDSWLVNKFISCKSRFQVDSKCVEIADGTEKREARFTSYVPAIAVRMSHKNSTGVAARQRHWDKRRKKTFKKGVTKTKKEDGEIRSLQEAWDKVRIMGRGHLVAFRDTAPGLTSGTGNLLVRDDKRLRRKTCSRAPPPAAGRSLG